MLNKITRLYRELGAGPMADYLARRLLGTVGIRFHYYRLFAQPVPDKPWLLPRANNSFHIREIAAADYHPEWFPPPAPVIQDRYAQGARCWVAFKQEQAVGCQWLLPGPYREDEVRCRFLPLPQGQTAWDFDVYIRPEHRLGRLFLLLWDNSNAWLREQGVGWSASRIDNLNLASIRSHQRMGAVEVGRAWFLGIGRWQLSHSAAGWHLSGHDADRPDIPVGPLPTPATEPEHLAVDG